MVYVIVLPKTEEAAEIKQVCEESFGEGCCETCRSDRAEKWCPNFPIKNKINKSNLN